MLLRKALMAALVIAPFVYSPSAAVAQSSARADEVGAGQKSHANQNMPQGVANRFDGQTLPPGIRRTRQQESEPVDETVPDDGTGDTGDTGTSEPVCLAYQNVLVGFTYQQVCVLWGSL